ncbi:Butyrophilin-like protein 2, partial [Anas platyrhynchos]
LRVEGPGHPVTAAVGQDVVLPCHLSPQRDAHSLDVRWIWDKFSETVHHYRDGEDLYGEQMGEYAGRTELSRDGLSAGSLDLRITGLRPSDDGRYICTVEDADAYAETIVELEVSATGADPHLSLGGYEAGGVRVLCRSAGWYPLPQLLWRDARGQHLPSVSQTHSQDQEGLFEIEGAVIVTGSVEGPLSCVVRSSRLQQEREFLLHIAGALGTVYPTQVAVSVLSIFVSEPKLLLKIVGSELPRVGWIRDHISETVHHYRNGEDLYGEQMGAYAGRTELVRDGLSAGSLDLRITGLRPSDDGQYVCTVRDAHAYDEAIVELEV